MKKYCDNIPRMGFEKICRVVKVMNNQRVTAWVGGKKCYFRSILEYKWARYLQFLKESQQIRDWQFEPKTFYFRNVKTKPVQYKPDFRITDNNGSSFFQETKGHHDGDTNSKFRRMSQQYPDVVMELVLENIPQNGKGVNKRQTAAKYVRRIINAREIFSQTKNFVNYELPIIQDM